MKFELLNLFSAIYLFHHLHLLLNCRMHIPVCDFQRTVARHVSGGGCAVFLFHVGREGVPHTVDTGVQSAFFLTFGKHLVDGKAIHGVALHGNKEGDVIVRRDIALESLAQIGHNGLMRALWDGDGIYPSALAKAAHKALVGHDEGLYGETGDFAGAQAAALEKQDDRSVAQIIPTFRHTCEQVVDLFIGKNNIVDVSIFFDDLIDGGSVFFLCFSRARNDF